MQSKLGMNEYIQSIYFNIHSDENCGLGLSQWSAVANFVSLTTTGASSRNFVVVKDSFEPSAK